LAARYGGEEFALVLIQTESSAAQSICERLRFHIAANPFMAVNPPLHITASFGVASYPSTGIKKEKDLVEAADQALYQAKKGGRNKVVLFEANQT